MPYLLIFFGLLFLQACAKPPIYDPVPTLSFVRFNVDTIQQQSQTLTIVVGFTDGDGDIGGDGNTNNFLIIDQRRGDTSFYTIPAIPRIGVSDGISGEIEVDIAPICCINPDYPIACSPIPDYTDQARFIIRLRDNAGQWSNEAETKALYIRCD